LQKAEEKITQQQESITLLQQTISQLGKKNNSTT